MRIRTRTLLVVVIIVALVVTVSLLVATLLVFRGLQQRENLEVRETLRRSEEALSVEIDQLSRTSRDWAVWDESYRFMLDHNQAFLKSTLTTSAIDSLDVDFVGFVDRFGRVVRVVSGDADLGSGQRLPGGVDRLFASEPEAVRTGVAGVIATPQGPMLLATEPITRSDGTGPGVGTFVVGKYIGKGETDLLARLAGAEVSISGTPTPEFAIALRSHPESRGAGVVVPMGRDSVGGHKLVTGLDGRTAFALSITQPRTTMNLAQRNGTYLIVAGMVASAGLVISILFAVGMVVTRRLERLDGDVRAVAQDKDFAGRVNTEGDDEISALADNINLMLAALHEAEQKLEDQACHDSLTMLHNRRRFEEDLDRELAESARLGTQGALLWLDIDNFKDLNDTLGHAVGDHILVEFAEELTAETRGYATLARIGGDEFALILPSADRTEAELAAGRLVELLGAHVFLVSTSRIRLRVSIGIALYPDHAIDSDDLFVCADIAMYDAKKSGGDRYCVYDGQRLIP